MSIDSIIKIHIESQNITMAQAGFGTPLVVGTFDHPDEWRVRTFSTINELLEWSAPKLSDAKKDLKEQELKKTSVYQAVRVLLSQSPRVERVKVGRIKEGEDLIKAFSEICLEDEDFYGVLVPDSTKDVLKLAEIIAQKRMILGLDINDDNLSIAAELQTKKNNRVFCIFSPKETPQYLASAWMGKMLPQAPGSSSWAFKELKEVRAYGLSTAKISELEKNNVNRYIGIKGMGVCLDGRMIDGTFIDITCGIDWLHARMQERLFRVLMINKKIPYTLKGIDLVRSEILAQLKEGVYRGFLAEEPEPFVSTPAIQDIAPNIRSQRILPDVRFNARLAGAIHKIEIQGTVSV